MTSPSSYVTRIVPRVRRHRLLWWRAEMDIHFPTELGGAVRSHPVAVCWSHRRAQAVARAAADRRRLLLRAIGVNVAPGAYEAR